MRDKVVAVKKVEKKESKIASTDRKGEEEGDKAKSLRGGEFIKRGGGVARGARGCFAMFRRLQGVQGSIKRVLGQGNRD